MSARLSSRTARSKSRLLQDSCVLYFCSFAQPAGSSHAVSAAVNVARRTCGPAVNDELLTYAWYDGLYPGHDELGWHGLRWPTPGQEAPQNKIKLIIQIYALEFVLVCNTLNFTSRSV